MNLAQLRRHVQQKIGLDTTSSGTEETLVDEWLNQGVVDLLLRTKCNVNSDDMYTTANQDDYTLDTDILAIQDIVYTPSNGGARPVTRTTPNRIIELRQGDGTIAGSGATHYALNGNDMMMFYPTPTAVDKVTVYYVPRPTAMSVTSHDPSSETYGGIPSEYHLSIVYFALAQAADYDDDTTSGMGEYYRQRYEEWVVRVRQYMRDKGGRYMGPAPIGRLRRLAYDNSQYPKD